MLAIVPETGREVNGGCESAQKGEKKSPLFWGRGGWERLFPALLERAGTRASQVGAVVGFPRRRWNGRERCPPGRGPISLEKWGKEHQREGDSFPLEPHPLVRGTGEGDWSGRGLACGLKDQRLMARPPARAGGRSGLLTGGESGKPNGYSLPFPKGYLPTSPARPAGGRAVTGLPM